MIQAFGGGGRVKVEAAEMAAERMSMSLSKSPGSVLAHGVNLFMVGVVCVGCWLRGGIPWQWGNGVELR